MNEESGIVVFDGAMSNFMCWDLISMEKLLRKYFWLYTSLLIVRYAYIIYGVYISDGREYPSEMVSYVRPNNSIYLSLSAIYYVDVCGVHEV